MKRKKGKYDKPLILVLILTFSFRLYLLANSTLTFYSDDAIYAELARFLLQGKWDKFFHPTWPPLYPLFSAISFAVFRNWEVALRFVSLIAGTLIIIPLYKLSNKTMSKIHSLLFITSVSLLAPFMKLAIFPFSDMLSTFFLISAIVTIYFSIIQDSRKYYLLGSFFIGLTYLTRSEGILFFYLSFSFLLTYFALKSFVRRKNIIKHIKILFLFVATFYLTASPYLISSRIQFGRWSTSHKASAQVKQWESFKIRKNSGLTWSQEVVSVKDPNYYSENFTGGLVHTLEYSDWFWFLFMQKIGKWSLLLKESFPFWVLPVVAVGIFSSFRKKEFWANSYIIYLLTIATPITIFSTPLVDIRYLMWTLPFILLYIYKGIKVLVNFIPIGSSKKVFSALIAFTLISFFPIINFASVLRPSAFSKEFTKIYTRWEIKDAGLWIKNDFNESDPKIMMRHEGIEFYADGYTVYTPQELSFNETLDYAKKLNTNYIVALPEEVSGGSFETLLLENSQFDRLKEVFRKKEDGRILVIYELLE